MVSNEFRETATSFKPITDKVYGGHMYHPVIVDDAVIVEPYGYSLSDGSTVHRGLPPRGGCGTHLGRARCVAAHASRSHTCEEMRKHEWTTSQMASSESSEPARACGGPAYHHKQAGAVHAHRHAQRRSVELSV